MDDLLSIFNAPIPTSSSSGNSYGGLFNAKPVSTTLSPTPTPAPTKTVAPTVAPTFSLLSNPLPPSILNLTKAATLQTSTPATTLPSASSTSPLSLFNNPLPANILQIAKPVSPTLSSGMSPLDNPDIKLPANGSDLFTGQNPVRLPFGTTNQTAMVGGGKATAGVVGFIARLMEAIPQAVVTAGQNFKSNGQIIGGGTDTGTKLSFDPTRLGLPANADDKVYSSGTRMVNDFNNRMDASPNTPKMNALQSIITGPLQDAFNAEFAGSTISDASKVLLGATGLDRETLDAASRLGINPNELRSLSPEEAQALVTKQATQRIKAVVDAAQENLSKGVINGETGEVIPGSAGQLPKDVIDTINAIGQDVGKIADGYFHAPQPNMGALGDLLRDTADQLTRPLEDVGKEAPFQVEHPEAEKLPGYRAENPTMIPAGLSTERVEPVGFGEAEHPNDTRITPESPQTEPSLVGSGQKPIIDNVQTNSNIDINGNNTSQSQAGSGQVQENSGGTQPSTEGLSGLPSVVSSERDGSGGIRAADDRTNEALHQGEQPRGYSEAAIRHAKFDLIDRSEDFGKLKPQARISLASDMMKEYGLPSSISDRFVQVTQSLPLHIQENFDGLKYTDNPNVNASLGIDKDSKWSLYLNPEKFGNQIYRNTRLIDHEITGHLTYRMTNPETRTKINDYTHTLLDDPEAFDQVWTGDRDFTPEQVAITKANYAHVDIDTISDELSAVLGSDDEATKVLSDLGFVSPEGNTPTDISTDHIKQVINAKQTVLAYLEKTNPAIADKLRTYLSNKISDFSNEVFARSVEYSAENPLPLTGEIPDMVQKLSTGATPSELYEPNSARKDFASISDQGPLTPHEQKLDQLHRQLQRAADSLRSYNSNPEAHIKAYGSDRSGIYKAKIDELNEKINDLTNNSPTKQKAFELEQTREDLENILADHPAKDLMKYVSKTTGRLPEVTGKTTMKSLTGSGKTVQNSRYGVEGDDISKSNYNDLDDAQKGVEEYQGLRDKLEVVKDEMKAMKPEIAKERVLDKEKTELEKKQARAAKKEADAQAERELRSQFDPLITDANADVIPPEVRGGLRAPEVEWDKFKDKPLIALQRETMNRNIEKVAPDKATAKKLNDFFTDKITENETAKVRAANKMRTEIGDKLKSLGIKINDKDVELIMHIGEGRMSRDEAAKFTDRAPVLKEAADYFRSKYDQIIDQWNQQLRTYGFKEVPKRPDYFRHFDDVDFFTKQYGFLTNKNMNNLPTSIAGDTEFFKPNKPFSNASLRRLGHQTSYNPIKGMDNYIDSTFRQIYHTDSVQRGRAIQKYMTEVAKAKENTADPIHLQNFKMALNEYVDSQLAGKLGTIDRAIEKTVGRPVVSAIQRVSSLIGKNIIGGNLSPALSHLVSIPLNLATTNKIPMVKGILSTLTSPLKAEPYNSIDGQESDFLTRRFPQEYILPSKIDKAERALGIFMEVSDRFKVKLAVSGKYFEGREAGMTKPAAMKAADEYAARIVGDRTTGGKPNIMNNRSAQLFAQFQLALNDGISVLAHDMPYNSPDKKSAISKYIQYAIYVWLLNHYVFKKSRGTGRGIDPIDLGMTLTGLNAEGKDETIPKRIASAGSDLLGELPFTNMFTGDFPVKEAMPNVSGLLTGKTTPLNEAERLGSDLLSPVGGGAQALKTFRGLTDVQKGSTFTATGKPKSSVAQTPGNYVRGVLFGPSALNVGAGSQTKPNSKLSGITLTKKTNGGVKLQKNSALKGIKLVKKASLLSK